MTYLFTGWSAVGPADAGEQPRPGRAAQAADAGWGRALPSPRGWQSSSPVETPRLTLHPSPTPGILTGTKFKLLTSVVLFYCCLYTNTIPEIKFF